MLECEQSQVQQYFQIQGQITLDVLVCFIIELIPDLMGIYIVAKLHICRCQSTKKVKYGKFSNSRADNSDSSCPIRSIIKLLRDLMITYILTKFGADWSIFVDDRE